MDFPDTSTVGVQWFDLSTAQRSIWLELQLLDDPAAYQLGGWVRIDAALDVDLAIQAVKLVVARNDSLRLRVDDQLPRMRLEPASSVRVATTDLSRAPDPHQAFKAFADAEFARGLPLGDAPLLRVDLVQAGACSWYLLWRCHHLINDQLSTALGMQRWTEAYDALAGEAGIELSPAGSFLSSLQADRAYEASPQAAADLAYWRPRLALRPEPLFNPTASAAIVAPAQWQLAGAPCRAFVNACRRCGVTTERGVLGLAAVILASLFDRTSIVLGVALHRRDVTTRETLGMFAGVMPAPCEVDPYAALDEAVTAIGRVLDRDMRHRRASLDAIGRAIGAGHDNPVVEIVVSHVVEDTAPKPLALAGMPITSQFYRAAETTPLALYAFERRHSETISFELAANPACIDAALLHRLAAALQRAMLCFVDAPATITAELDLLEPDDRATILHSWSGTQADFPPATYLSAFGSRVGLVPGCAAVVWGGGVLSFAALDLASDAVAVLLQGRGVGVETVVGVAMARSVETVVCALGVLKAGGVYLPLDPSYPAERLAFMLRDAGAALVLTDAASAAGLPAEIAQMQFDITADITGGGRPAPVALRPDHLAYIVYTSGSTGTPKGVGVSHASAVHVALARCHGHDPIGPGDRVLAAISVGFDVSIGQLLLPLLAGACVVVAPDLRTLSAAEFWVLLAESRVSHINSVPSFFDSVLDAAPADTGLQRLMLGGEALSAGLCRRLQLALPGTTVVNMYGPTEACIDATAHIVPREPGDGIVAIGRPLANYRAYVLDSRMRPVAPGIAGELFLGGPGLARGYIGQPGLTASRFVADPFGPSGGRLYRTGDRVLWRADGSLAFLGRNDGQVKIRGFRVELGEIEAALRSHVGQAAVAAHADGRGGTTLCAYLVGDAPDLDQLRANLARQLPAHMLPTDFITLDHLPLTENGKLDRKALPRPTARAAREHVAPATPLERQVAAMFEDVLEVGPVGAGDDFFALGGHSLSAIRLVSRVRAELGVELPVRSVFASPTVAGLAAVLQRSSARDSLPPLIAQPQDGPAPLSFAQERLWVLEQLAPDTNAYIIPTALALTGSLDAGALEAALRGVVARHDILRTRFETRDGAAVQIVTAPSEAPVLECVDLASLPASDRDAAVRAALQQAERAPFDLGRGPLLRARLLRLGADRHVLILALHHIIADGWSMGVLLREITTLYAAFAQGRPDPLAPLALSYADYSRWQRGWLTGPLADALVQHWREALAGAPEQLDLPHDRARPTASSMQGAVVPWRCSPALAEQLRAQAQAAGATVFMLLLTAFQALLSRWSGVDDIVVGTPIAQRNRAETEPLVGFFVNTLAMRARFSPGLRFCDALARGRETILDAFAHQDLPFEMLVQALAPERDLVRQPLVQAMFALQNTPMPTAALPGVRLEPLEIAATVAKFELTLSLAETADGGLEGGFEYATDWFEHATIARLAGWFTQTLSAIAADPATQTGALDLLTAAERERLLSDWTPLAVPAATLPALFRAQAHATPLAEAVIDGDRIVSFAALDAASDAVAAGLQARGVGLETVVGVAYPRSLETVVTLLGVLKAGGVYLPLDPAYPPERLTYMTADAGAALVLTKPEPVGPRSITPTPVALQPGHLAYIIYTSGSTGTPKGVAISHASAVNIAHARRHGYDPIGPGDRILATASISFDVSFGQLLLPLLAGACVVIAPDLRTLSGPALWCSITEQRITQSNLVPSLIESVLDDAPADLQLDRLILGGEPLSHALAQRVRAALPSVQVINAYGPTETTIDATAYLLPHHDTHEPATLPIGRPLANYRAYVVDPHLRLLPPGIAGELLLGGPGLARGYIGQPGLTASRFVADPFGPSGGRLYRTGDRVLWRPDSTLAFLGRNDSQIKIRGFRIELGEIEAALRSYQGIWQTAVIVRKDPPGDARLVAYVVGAAAATELRAYLAERLPGYMVPSAFVSISSLPLNRNGKLDKAALPMPAAEPIGGSDRPIGEREELLCTLFAELTGASAVGRNDGFFNIGGDSIGAIRLVSLARSRGGLSIQVRDVFAHPTPHALSTIALTADATPQPSIEPTGELLPTPLQRALLANRAPIDRFHQAVALHPPSGLDPTQLATGLARLVTAHPSLRIARGGDLLSVVADAPEPVLQHVDHPADLAAAIRTLSAFDLASGRTVAAILATQPDQPPTLFIAIHHLAVDGLSLRILLDDLALLCSNDTAVPPPSLPMRAWTTYLHTQASARRSELPLWREMLSAPSAVPTTEPGGDNTIGASRTLTRSLSSAATLRLLAAPAVYNAEINDILLAALALALSAWHRDAGRGRDVHGIMLEGHGREAGSSGLDITRTVGWFTATYPVCVDLSGFALDDALAGGDAAGEAIKRAKAVLRRLPDHGLGYGLLRHLDQATELVDYPEPTLLLNYLGRFAHAAAVDEHQWRPAPMPVQPDDDQDRRRDPVLLEANAILDGTGALHIAWTYAPAVGARAASLLADQFLRALDAIGRHCAERPLPRPQRLIAADFPEAQASGLAAPLLAELLAETPDLDAVLPLTPLQQGLAFESMARAGDVDPYFVQGVLRLAGSIEPARMQAAWMALIERHDVLRLAMPPRAFAAGLAVLRPTTPAWAVHDWSDATPDQAEQLLANLLTMDRGTGTDLQAGPLIRMALIRRGAAETWLLASNHHALLDGWSTPILIGELLAAYQGQTLPPTLPWRAVLGWINGNDRAEAAAFWAERLGGLSSESGQLRLPAPDRAEQGTAETFARLPQATSNALERFSRRHGLTMATITLGAWALLLRPLQVGAEDGARDLVLGVVSSGRPATLPGSERAVGLFIQTLPLRVTVAGATLLAWLQALQNAVTEQEAHGWLGLLAIRKAAGLLTDNPPFQALFVFENYPVEAFSDGPIRLLDVSSHDATHYPVSLAVLPGADGLGLRLTFDRAIVSGGDADTLLARLRFLLEVFGNADPAVTIDDLPSLSDPERDHVLALGSGPNLDFPPATYPSAFGSRVGLVPGCAAVVWGGGVLSFAALDLASDAVAVLLQGRGVEVETVVGVAMARSVETVVCALGVLKAGGVYLPLDPSYPAERLAFMLRDAGAALVLTDAASAAGLPAEIAQMQFDITADITGGGRPAPVALRPDHLAYIVYTSGSTGTPKGVGVSHASAVHVALARCHGHDPIGPGDRVLAAISVGFDVSIGQLLLPLLAGACVVVAPDLRTLSAAEFWVLLAESRVSHINSVPSFFDSVLDAAPADTGLQRLMLGGEALSAGLCRRLQLALPGTTVVNMYGPTEACIDATAHIVPREPGDGIVAIGRPLANYRAYVLDSRMRPVAPGIAGELFLGGPGLARGYIGQPGLTASRFVADPFGPSGGRLYRTGDRVLWRADGSLAFLGRNDGQVKIRGFRVELGEIEAALRSHVGQAAVAAHADGRGGTTLCAYLVGDAPDLDQLRANLARQLPAHMLPTDFITLDHLPLTENGKLDRKALPRPTARAAREHVAPATPLERQVAAMFEDVLEVGPVGAGDDFFALGGHSLSAIRLVSRVRAELGVELPVRSVFASPTVAGLAAVLQRSSARDSLPPLIAQPQDGPAPLSFAQERLWVLEQLAPDTNAYIIPTALALTGSLDAGALEAALRGVVARHDILRTRFETRDGAAVQIVTAPSEAPVLECVDLASLPASDRDAAVRAALQQAERAPFDLGRGPLLRARLLRLGADRHVLILALHHIIADGWSMGVLLREITTLYAAFAQGRPDPLAPLALSYADYSRWQRGWLTGPLADALVQHWREALAGAPEQLDLPHDRARPTASSMQGAVVPWRCSPALAEQLRAQAQAAGATVFMLLLTAFQALLSRWSGVDDIVVGTPIAQRNRAETEPLVGFFVNTLAMRARFTPGLRFCDALARGRETILDAFAHQDLPFEMLVQALAPERDLVRQPLVQAMFALQNTPMPTAALPGVRLEPLEIAATVAKFELTLSLAETADGGLEGGFEYATDWFEHATIARLAGWFTQTLSAIAADPATQTGALDLLTAAERERLLSDWTPLAVPAATLPALFRAQAHATPLAEAVIDGDRIVSFAALDAASDAVAAGLQARGVGLETVVGVAYPRSLETVVTLLGVLKAGGVYLPLDPAYPPERLTYMTADAGAALVLTEPEPIGPGSITPTPVALQPGHLAYIVYTSGSTGTPKGVGVSHASAVHVALARCHGHDPIGPGDRVLAAISVGFDVSIGQLLLPLLAGACVVVAPDLRTLSAAEFWVLLAESRVSHINSVPSFFDSVLDAAPADTGLQRLMLGGEALSAGLCRRLQLALPGTTVVNMYGPTETCIDATAHIVPREPGDGIVAIGRPLANYRAYVLDSRMRPVAPGIAGELFLGGPGLARGYIGQPGLTASRFVADPFGPSGGRLYRTGDRVLWRPDSTLAFLGRNDSQIKIRGFRIELGEIEAALRSHVGQAAVAAHADGRGGTTLCAYLVGDAPDLDQLRANLARQLPAHMLPTDFITLDHLPLTENGKLDRKALPRPTARTARNGPTMPRDETEFRLQAIWQTVLNLPTVGLRDDFFALGGHSLAAIRLIGAVNAAFSAALPMTALFETPTIETLAASLRTVSTRTASPVLTLRAGRNDAAALVCLHPQGGTTFCYMPLLNHLASDRPFLGVHAAGLADGEQRPETMAAMAAAYITALPPGPAYLLGFSFGGAVAYEMAVQMRASGRDVIGLTLLDALRPGGDPLPAPPLEDLLAMLGEDLGLAPPASPWLTTEALFDAAKAADLAPSGFTLEQAERIVAVWVNNSRLVRDYTPMTVIDVPMLQVRATQRDAPLTDWSSLTSAPVETVDFDCGHRDVIVGDHARIVAGLIERHLLMGNA